MVEILMKLEAQMFKAMHQYMGISFDDYSHIQKETSKSILKHIMKEFQTWSIQSEKNKTRVMSITLANLITLDVHNENAMKNLLVKAEDENKLYSACICSWGGGQGIQKTCDICQNRNI